ncbi:metallophosphoesterase [Candidatus Margulisiibacteriota bacterium]
MLLNFLRFFSMLLGIVFLAHAFLYFSLVKFFSITTYNSKAILFYTLFILAISFILASLIFRLSDNLLTKLYYFISSIWYGFLVYLILASILLWFIKIIITPFNLQPNFFHLLAITLYSIAFLITVYGIYNAFNPVITRISVPIKNLPREWENKKIIQVSDLHLGPVYGYGFMKKIAGLIEKEDPEIILITGDLFDGSSANHAKFVPALNLLQAKKGVYFASGNHEIYSGYPKIMPVIQKSSIELIDNKIINLDGLQIIGLGYPDFYKIDYPKFKLKNNPDFNPKLPSILLFHSPSDIKDVLENNNTSHNEAYFKPNTKYKTAQELGISLQLSGHTHAGQIFPFTLLTKQIFKGFHYGLHKLDGFHIYITSGTGTWGPPVRLGCPSEVVVITLRK